MLMLPLGGHRLRASFSVASSSLNKPMVKGSFRRREEIPVAWEASKELSEV